MSQEHNTSPLFFGNAVRYTGAAALTLGLMSPAEAAQPVQEQNHADVAASTVYASPELQKEFTPSVEQVAMVGSWTIGYTCSTDSLNFVATSPAAGNYGVDVFSPVSNTQGEVAVFTVAPGQSEFKEDVPMADVNNAGMADATNLEVNIVDKSVGEVIAGTVIDTTGTVCAPEVTPTPTVSVEPYPTYTPAPSPSPTAPLYKEQTVRMPKKNKFIVGKKYKLARSTEQGVAIDYWAARGRNKKGKRVCKEIVGVTKKKEPKFKVKAMHPGNCKVTVIAPPAPGYNNLVQKKQYKVVKRKK